MAKTKNTVAVKSMKKMTVKEGHELDVAPNFNRVYFYLFLLACLGLTFLLIRPYLNVIFLSFTVVTLFHPVFSFFAHKLKLSRTIATILSLIIVFFTFLIPFVFLVEVSIDQGRIIYQDINEFVKGRDIPSEFNNTINLVNQGLSQVPFMSYRVSLTEIQSSVEQNVVPFSNFLLNNSLNIGGYLFATFPLIILFGFILWSSFADYDKFLNYLNQISPLPDHLDRLYFRRIYAMTKAMIKGTFLIAVVQGCFGGIILWLVGTPYVFLWTLLMIFLSIVPLGSGFVSIPIALIRILTGDIWQGIFILVLHVGVGSNIDNFLRPMLIPKEAEIHPVLLLLGVLGGIQMFGFFGFVYGPLIMIVLITTLEIYLKYYRIKSSYESEPAAE